MIYLFLCSLTNMVPLSPFLVSITTILLNCINIYLHYLQIRINCHTKLFQYSCSHREWQNSRNNHFFLVQLDLKRCMNLNKTPYTKFTFLWPPKAPCSTPLENSPLLSIKKLNNPNKHYKSIFARICNFTSFRHSLFQIGISQTPFTWNVNMH